MKPVASSAALIAALWAACPADAELTLLMFEQPGCLYCARWHAEVGPEYPLTAEGKAAPLRQLQIHETLPEGLVLDRKPVFTPTFVLVDDGVEVGRIEGYLAEDFFWPYLAGLIADAGG